MILSLHDAIQNYIKTYSGMDKMPHFVEWWYWQECGTRENKTYIQNYDVDYVARTEWRIKRGITPGLLKNAEETIRKNMTAIHDIDLVQNTSTDAKLEGTRLAVSVVGLLNSFNYKLNDAQLLEVIQLCERLASTKS